MENITDTESEVIREKSFEIETNRKMESKGNEPNDDVHDTGNTKKDETEMQMSYDSGLNSIDNDSTLDMDLDEDFVEYSELFTSRHNHYV